MKRFILSIVLATALLSCGKDKDYCYECDPERDGTYTDYGCHTSTVEFSDQYGQPIPCRRK